MANFKYDSLALGSGPSDREIRVLEVRPDLTEDELISCKLEASELSDTHMALSYTWREVLPRYTILVNSAVFKVDPSLFRFLTVAKKHHHSKPLWIDDICIDQNSVPERNQQVAFMADIYVQAKLVLVWLGQADSNVERALRHLSLSSREILFEDENYFSDTIGKAAGEPKLAAKRNYFTPIAAGIRDLCNLEYWERCWVVQEFRLSGSKTLLYGEELASAEALSDGLLWLHRLADDYPQVMS